ncbi:hypothetical protein [Kribbella catacumbae]|uniref:hypothetical protein n=1 Tax=Kribbella catacumbae TaxID=460086 RepID=UPI00036114DC|nr:hypothetical protein [Kribbella catacumbae]
MSVWVARFWTTFSAPASLTQFPLRDPAVPAVVVGARAAAEVSELAGLLEYEIPEGFWAALRKGS